MTESKKESFLLAIILSIITAIFIISASIAVPIIFRPFYYMQINALDIEAESGYSHDEIVTAYNEVLDYCLGFREDFSTGRLPWSEAGRDHFKDVRGLFLLDIYLAVATIILLLLWRIIRKKIPISDKRPLGHGYGFWGSIGLIFSFLFIGSYIAIDFDNAFIIFHSIFFPGKDNWLFDWNKDQIIRILPEQFFMNCAILAIVLIFILASVFIITDLKKGKKGTDHH